MIGADWIARSGCTVEHLNSVTSTSTVALARARAGERGALWLVADEQTDGRGRHGRRWRSPSGNLYASRLVVSGVATPRIAELGFVAGLAVYDASRDLLRGADDASLFLKWPNDLMARGAKLAGVLIEVETIGRESAAAVGIGLNIVETVADRPAASLAGLGALVSARDAFSKLGEAFERWFEIWNAGRGFPEIRIAWLARAAQLGEPTSVRLGDELIEGRFGGIDSDGALLVARATGEMRRIAAGDVFMAGEAG